MIKTTAHLDPYCGPQDHAGWKAGVHRPKYKSRLYREINSWMEFLCIVINSERNFFRVSGGVEKELEGYLKRYPEMDRKIVRQELINAIHKKIEEFL